MNVQFASPVPTRGDAAPPLWDGTGFKEWSIVCDALGTGLQSLILRKGGIAEGRDGFCFKHEEFLLFPTQFHEQLGKVRPEETRALVPSAPPASGTVAIRYGMTVEFACWVDDPERIRALEPLHIWRDEVVRERFEYDGRPGLQCAFGRVYRAGQAWTFPDRPAYGGCRSWVTLPPPPPELPWEPVLSREVHEQRGRAIADVLGLAYP